VAAQELVFYRLEFHRCRFHRRTFRATPPICPAAFSAPSTHQGVEFPLVSLRLGAVAARGILDAGLLCGLRLKPRSVQNWWSYGPSTSALHACLCAADLPFI